LSELVVAPFRRKIGYVVYSVLDAMLTSTSYAVEEVERQRPSNPP
jgi:hypothetical protein